jgi:RNA polymerase sigma factor (TIGR02999 family)
MKQKGTDDGQKRGAVEGGGHAAAGELLPLVYDQLRDLASKWFQHQPPDHILQPTALVHEAFLKMCESASDGWKNRDHFLAVAATAMRQVLIDYARRQNAAKRGGGWQRVTLAELPDRRSGLDVDLIALDEALTDLNALNERQCRIAELRFLAGLSNAEAARVLGVSIETVKGEWRMTRAWLMSRLGQKGV